MKNGLTFISGLGVKQKQNLGSFSAGGLFVCFFFSVSYQLFFRIGFSFLYTLCFPASSSAVCVRTEIAALESNMCCCFLLT